MPEEINYDGQRICNVPDHYGSADCLWPFLDVGVYVTPGAKLGEVSLADAFELAIKGWNDVCGLKLFMATNAKTAHILTGSGQIDGPSNILAQSELPCGFQPGRWRQLNQLFDASEAWTIADNPPANKIDAVRVICHEVGHAWGCGHISTGNLMAPVYSAQLRWPQRGDIAEARARYGLPAPSSPPGPPAQPPVPPPSVPGDAFLVTATRGAEIWQGALKRIQ